MWDLSHIEKDMYSMIKCEKKRKRECICGLHIKTTLHISKYFLHNFSEHYPVSQIEEIENKVNKLTHAMQLAK